MASVAVGTWACFKMGWARLLFAGALFPPGEVAEENRVPQRLVVEGPYRYVRNPLYDTDFLLILGTALLTRSWGLVLLAALYAAQLALQPSTRRERVASAVREPLPALLPARAPICASSSPLDAG